MNKQPNIILILADDMGFSDIGAYGSEIDTPNLNKLAAEGLRFSSFYNTPRCCPTRASIMTGLYPHQTGVGFMDEDIEVPSYQGRLHDRCVTIAEALKEQYNCLMVGKWHLGKSEPDRPYNRGFHQFTGLLDGASNYFKPEPHNDLIFDNEPYIPPQDDFYLTDWFSGKATDYIEKYGRADKPFFMYLAYTAPHWPLQAPEEVIAKYRGQYRSGWDEVRQARYKRLIDTGILDAESSPLSERDSGVPPWESIGDQEAWDLKMAVYAAMIDRMDQGIGSIMNKLAEMDIDSNTLVMFLSDNGACAEWIGGDSDKQPGSADSYLSYRLPWANVSNTPFRMYKHMVHEGGISTPFIARWPNRIQDGGAVTHQVGHIIDIMATCLDAAGMEYPAAYNGKPITPLEGKSLLPIMAGEEREGHDCIFWEHEGNKAVRQGRWKIISRSAMDWQFLKSWGYQGDRGPHEQAWELYDIASDRVEQHDLASRFPEKAAELAADYETWSARVGVIPWEEYMKRTNTGYLLDTLKMTDD